MSIGQRIRRAREQGGLSLRALASRTEVSAGYMSQVERDLANPSLEILRRIAAVLGVPLFDLFHDVAEETPAVVRKEGRVSVTSPQGGIAYSRLSPGAGRLEVLEGILTPGGRSSEEPWSHPSEECVVVLAGQLGVEVDGQLSVLAEGDSCYFDSRLPHRYLNDGEAEVRFLLSITPPSY